ncbi:UNVERIFIED_CONTAM: Isoprene synthase, chloroplastic [Sesamum calycinum]|uniref:Isoprene synthase, chloroplastic n=2 Tax=Sesamum TaxID=4181 RepID=A0AAW2SFA3_9LAMI
MKQAFLPSNLQLMRWKIQCTAAAQQSVSYQPSSWSYDFIQSIGDDHMNHVMEVEEDARKKMEDEVRCMLENEDVEPLVLIELIDDIDRLGIAYRFQETIDRALERVLLQSSQVEQKMHDNLHSCALCFRVLRRHGYHVSTDIFESFKDSNGNFTTSLATDVEGMLSLYEASHLALDGESMLDKAREFTSFHLKNMLGKMDMKSAMRVNRALELPSHHRMQRLEARWNIEMYDKQDKAIQLLRKLATLDFNLVQKVHQRDLQEASRWWRHVGLANKLSFARDRLMESFFWTVGMISEPQFSKCRVGLTKVVKLITVLDDIYDVYGSADELELLTNAVDKWDVNAVNDLPDYMKLFFFALYNTVNDMAYDTLKEQDQVIISQLKKVWTDLCKAFLREAEWRYKKEIPRFDEYLDHGWTSSSGVVLLTHTYFLTTQNITHEAIKALNDGHGLLRSPSTVFRLANDLSSSKDDVTRGETAKAVSCYMHETGASDEVASAYIGKLIDQNWKMINKENTYNSALFGKCFIQTAQNLARIALCQYQHGDAHTAPTDRSRNRVRSVIMEPIHFMK